MQSLKHLKLTNFTILMLSYIQGDMILQYRIFHSNIGICFEDDFTRPFTSTRGHSYRIFKPQATTRVRLNFFTIRSVDVWNKII